VLELCSDVEFDADANVKSPTHRAAFISSEAAMADQQ
jgi:hypothetical protein